MSSVLPSEIPSPPPAVTTPQQVQCLNELERYAALMAEQEEREPSTAAPSVRSALGDAVFASSQGTEQEDMDLDRDKRRASEEAAEDSQSKPKCAKGEAKGDPKGSEQPVPSTPASTGKGRTAAPQTLPGQRQSGVASTTAPAEGTVDHRRRQRTQRQWGDQTWWGKDKRDHRSGIREDRFHDRDNSELRELVKAMARLTLRLEDNQVIQHLDSQFIIFMQTKEAAKGWSITASLYKVAQAWHKQKKEAPATLTQPLRTILFHCFLTSLRSRLQEMEENQELLLKAKELGLIEAQSYLYLTWSQEEKKYIKGLHGPARSRRCREDAQSDDSAFEFSGQRRASIRSLALSPRDPESHSRGQSTLSSATSPMQEWGFASHRGHDATIEDRPFAAGPSGGPTPAIPLRVAPQEVLGLQLGNPHNHCYANAFMLICIVVDCLAHSLRHCGAAPFLSFCSLDAPQAPECDSVAHAGVARDHSQLGKPTLAA